MMTKQFDIIKKTRFNFLQLVDSLTIKQLNVIPPGYNNNIAWNFGHIISVQQIICYSRAGITPTIDNGIIKKYEKGTKPEAFIDGEEIDKLKEMLLLTVDKVENDRQTDMFMNYTAFRTSYGVEITNITDAVQYFAVHDALHYGYSLSLKKNIGTE
jgi:hypothetical protein